LSIFMIRLAVTAILFLTFSAFTYAQSDPLGSTYQPTIDTNPAHYPANIWITDTMQKVRQDSGSPGSQHWGTFYGTQNEFVDFQVHFHDTGSGTSNLSVTVSNFVQSSPKSSTINCSTLGQCIVYREAYINLTNVSSTANAYYGVTGYYPDALIPAVDPYFNQTTNAWPFSVAANQNQSAWVDVHIPPAAPAGYYLGSVTVKSGSTTLATMPVVIGVWQWPSSGNMPSSASLASDFSFAGAEDACIAFYGSFANCANYPGAGGNSGMGVILSNTTGIALATDHRISMTDGSEDSNGGLSYYQAQWEANGSPSTLLVGAHPVGVNYYSAYVNGLSGWASWWNTNEASLLPSYTYDYCAAGCDEPHTNAQWTTVVNSANAAHAASPALPLMIDSWWESMTGQQSVYNSYGDVSSYVDILVVLNDCMEPQSWDCGNATGTVWPLQRSKYNTWLSQQSTYNSASTGITRQLWSYISCQGGGRCGNLQTLPTQAMGYNYSNYAIDGLPASNRVEEWMVYFHQQTGTLYYATQCSWGDTGCFQGTAPGNPWTNQFAFGNNGDGTLFYPSTFSGTNYVTASSGSALTTPIWLPSIRVKHIRDGMQDYEYLNVLTNKGKSSLVSTQIGSWITNSYTYEYSGSGLQSARMALGTAMHQLSYSSLLPPPSVKGTLQITK
jgi:hypothetical protein